MKPEDKKNVIEFYESQVWLPGMPKSDKLNDNNLNDLKDTLPFASWMLATKYNEVEKACVNTIKAMLQKIKL